MDNRNLVLAVVFSIAILLGFNFLSAYLAPPAPPPEVGADAAAGTGLPAPDGTLPAAPATTEPAPVPVDRASLLAEGQRIPIETPRLKGSIALTGAGLDDLVLKDYREAVGGGSPNIVLLSPKGATDAYYADFGWVGDPAINLPGPATLWQTDAEKLTPATPVTLRWDNGQGLVFVREIAIDENFMFTVTDRVENKSDGAVALYPYGRIARTGTPETLGFYILHEGPIGVFNGTLAEVDYSEVVDAQQIVYETAGGWLGITDKYWQVALVPDQATDLSARFTHTLDAAVDNYQADYRAQAIELAPGASGASTSRLFAGAKEVALLDGYGDSLGLPNFDRSVDFGWFYFLTKPIFKYLDFLNKLIGNFGVAILLLTLTIRLLLYPLADKSYRSMSRMKGLQPKMLELRERFKEDKPRLQKEMMELYKREKVNPAAGCLPILIQIPIFFALYKVLFVTIEMRHAPFFGWIKDLSAPDPTSFLNGFGLLPWDVPHLGALQFLSLGIWPLIMGITMWAQMKLNPTPPDPIQARIFAMLPIVFTFMLSTFAAGLVIYWCCNNLLSIAQQRFIMWRMGVKA